MKGVLRMNLEELNYEFESNYEEPVIETVGVHTMICKNKSAHCSGRNALQQPVVEFNE